MLSPTTDALPGLHGVVAIPVTPFSADGGIDRPALETMLRRIADAGVHAITPNGNTGEYYSLSPVEVRAALRIAAETVAPSLLVPGVGLDLGSAVAQAADAYEAGVRAVMVHQPVHPFQSADGWVRYHRAIAESVPSLGIVPYVRSRAVTVAMLAELGEQCPNLVAVKYAVPDVLRFAEAVRTVRPGVTWLCGLAETWAPYFWIAGARGFTSGLVNVRPELALALHAALVELRVEDAMEMWAHLRAFELLRARHGDGNNVSVVKEALASLGLCSRAVRAPISELPDHERREVEAILASWAAIRIAA